jgi:hypothetical protein
LSSLVLKLPAGDEKIKGFFAMQERNFEQAQTKGPTRFLMEIFFLYWFFFDRVFDVSFFTYNIINNLRL